MAASYDGARRRLKLQLEERRSANEHEEKFDDCDLPHGDFGSQPCRRLCAGYYYV
jgi:hypothetical protein